MSGVVYVVFGKFTGLPGVGSEIRIHFKEVVVDVATPVASPIFSSTAWM